ncbi:MAG: homocysteine S-methyltransferase family protein, partial [Thermoanaerobaculia bacterium]
MNLRTHLAHRSPILAEGSIYELLRRDPRVEFDPHIAHAGLIYGHDTRRLLADIHLAYADIAARHSLPLLALTDTWRASEDRVATSRFKRRSVNADNVAFLRELLSGREAFIAGLTGPAGDGYQPGEAPAYPRAIGYHAAQVHELAEAGADLLYASTLPNTVEAQAIGSLMAETGIPWTLSFVVRSDGTVLDGVPLADAIRRIDDAMSAPPVGYAINCVHSSTAAAALAVLPAALAPRIIAFQGNASRLSPEELDGRAE